MNQRFDLRGQAGVILWDFDETLAHRPGAWSGTLAEVILEYEPTSDVTVDHIRPFLSTGFPWHTPDIPHLEIRTDDQWWERIEGILGKACVGVGFAEETAGLLACHFRKTYLEPSGWIVYDDVRPVLTHLAEQGWRHVILSNHVPELPVLVDAIGLAPLVEHVITSARTGYEKPHPEAFRIALESAGNPETVWMVGDNFVADVKGAEDVGIRAVLVRNHDHRAARWSHDLRGVVDIVSSQGQRLPAL